MARTPLIPLRPKGFVSALTQPEQSALTWYVLSGCTKRDAFVTFARPDMLDTKSKAALDTYVTQFFARKDVSEYVSAYEKTLDEEIHPKPTEKPAPVGSLEERRAAAKTKLLEFAMSLSGSIETAADPDFVLKLADKVGLLDGDEKEEEAPRRYLPQSCGDHCAYRMFCEENTEDMCQYCRYHKFGEDNGIHYEKNNLLDVPEKVVDSE